MKRFKKTLRLLGFILLIVLASVGIGLGGGVPIPPANKKKDTIEIKVEMLESVDDKTKSEQFDIKQS